MDASSKLLPLLETFGWELPLFLLAMFALWFAKGVYQARESFHFHSELTDRDNPAFGTALAGYLLGATLALSAAFPKTAPSSWPELGQSMGWFALQGGLVALLMGASGWILAKGVTPRFGVSLEMVRDRNLGAGALVAGGSVASGLVLQAALSGNSDSPLLAFRDVLVLWAAGQLILVLGARCYCMVARYEVQKALEGDNVAAGLSLGGFLAALGIVVHAALRGASSDLAGELMVTGVFSLLGIGLLLLSNGIAG
ncbi:MAG: hypothetical protein RLZZ244_1593, partial [Verrucomicrobiota bacterium]